MELQRQNPLYIQKVPQKSFGEVQAVQESEVYLPSKYDGGVYRRKEIIAAHLIQRAQWLVRNGGG